MGDLSLVIVLGEAFAHSEFSSGNEMPMILTITAVSPISQDFDRVHNALSEVLLAMITGEPGTGSVNNYFQIIFLFLITTIQFTRIGTQF
jgi:hypothetical protein